MCEGCAYTTNWLLFKCTNYCVGDSVCKATTAGKIILPLILSLIIISLAASYWFMRKANEIQKPETDRRRPRSH